MVARAQGDGNGQLQNLLRVIDLQRALYRRGGQGVSLLPGAKPGELGQDRCFLGAVHRNRVKHALQDLFAGGIILQFKKASGAQLHQGIVLPRRISPNCEELVDPEKGPVKASCSQGSLQLRINSSGVKADQPEAGQFQ